jgi:hypothetical protein
MKIIQSFWTKPFFHSADFLLDSRLNGGWPARKFNYFSWALSCLQLSEYYTDVCLVTDDLGKYMLIDKLQLPYTSVAVSLNKLDAYDPGLWALGKIYAYSIQEEPFLHVDSDIFIWRKFDDRINNAGLAAQNREIGSEYSQTFDDICKTFDYIPEYLKELEGLQYVACSNAGIIGGGDIPFFKLYTGEVFRFIDENRDSIRKHIKYLNTAFVNVCYEQVIYNLLAEKNNKEISYLFPDHLDAPKDVGFFHCADANSAFVHCLGTFKKNRLVYRMLEIKLKTLYPEYYRRIVDLTESSEI